MRTHSSARGKARIAALGPSRPRNAAGMQVCGKNNDPTSPAITVSAPRNAPRPCAPNPAHFKGKREAHSGARPDRPRKGGNKGQPARSHPESATECRGAASCDIDACRDPRATGRGPAAPAEPGQFHIKR